ncbi:MAG: hypothetical protein IT442_05640 [Phycisphaeraceae bacterium]|nr:hypothetical protein [Phycisphaeraceae bacterium]
MDRLHVILVCHTELDFDGSWALYDRVQPQIERMFDRVAQTTGKRPRCTYCGTAEFLGEKLDDAFRLGEQADEVGIHSHLPGAHRPHHSYQGRYAYRFDDQGVLNQDRVAGPLRDLAIALGLPAPRAHVSGMFTFHQRTLSLIEDAGFTVDCSLLPGIPPSRHRASGDFVLADNSRHPDVHPYRPARDDPWVAGQSRLLEIPVSGWLGDADLSPQITDLRVRHDAGGVDAFQVYWHHFEFADLGWTHGQVTEAERFLVAAARMENVVFSTASQAALDFGVS